MLIQISQVTFNFLTKELPEFNMESLSRLAKLGEKQEQPEFTENVNEENSIPTVSDAPPASSESPLPDQYNTADFGVLPELVCKNTNKKTTLSFSELQQKRPRF